MPASKAVSYFLATLYVKLCSDRIFAMCYYQLIHPGIPHTVIRISIFGIKLAVNDISTIPSGQRSSTWVGTSVENLVWLGTREVWILV